MRSQSQQALATGGAGARPASSYATAIRCRKAWLAS